MAGTPPSPTLATLTISARQKPDGSTAIDATLADGAGSIAFNGTQASVGQPVAAPQQEAPPRPDTQFQRYLDEAREAAPVKVAVVHPCSEEAILAALEARDEGLLEPVLAGPEHKILQAADKARAEIGGLAIEPVEHSHAAAAHAVHLAASGRVAALMKGSLHTDEVLGAVVASGSGLRTQRRISHVYVLDTPA